MFKKYAKTLLPVIFDPTKSNSENLLALVEKIQEIIDTQGESIEDVELLKWEVDQVQGMLNSATPLLVDGSENPSENVLDVAEMYTDSLLDNLIRGDRTSEILGYLYTTGSKTGDKECPIGVRRTVGNVKDFGANGDGVTDDTRAIQNAIDNCDVVIFDSGIYYITKTLYLHSNLTLIGVNAEIHMLCSTLHFNVFKIEHEIMNFTMYGFSFSFDRKHENMDSNVFWLDYTIHYFFIYNCSADTTCGVFIYCKGSQFWSSVLRNILTHCTLISFQNGWLQDTLIENCYVVSGMGSCIGLVGSNNSIVKDCYLESKTIIIRTGAYYNLQIMHCYLTGQATTTNCIYITASETGGKNAYNLTVEYCIIRGAKCGVRFHNTGSREICNTNIKNCKFNNQEYDIYINYPISGKNYITDNSYIKSVYIRNDIMTTVLKCSKINYPFSFSFDRLENVDNSVYCMVFNGMVRYKSYFFKLDEQDYFVSNEVVVKIPIPPTQKLEYYTHIENVDNSYNRINFIRGYVVDSAGTQLPFVFQGGESQISNETSITVTLIVDVNGECKIITNRLGKSCDFFLEFNYI